MTYSDIVKDIVRLNLYNNFYEGNTVYSYKINDDDTNKIKSMYESQDIDNLVEKIKNIDNSFGIISTPDYVDPNLQKLDDVTFDEDQIINQATDSLAEYKNKSISNIENDYISQVDNYNNKKNDLANTLLKNKENISTYYNQARTRASNDALDRGVARSSIVINVLDAFDNNEISDLKKLDDEYTNAISLIDFKLDSLKVQREKALADFDIAYAVKLGDKINSLTSDLEKKRAEVIKYNNSIAEKEKKYLDDYNNMVADIQKSNTNSNNKMLDIINKYGEKAINKYRKNQIFNAMDEYFANTDSDSVLDILNNNSDLKNILGSDLDEYIARYKNGLGTNS